MRDARPAIDRPKYYYLAPLWRRLVVIVVCGLIFVPMVVIPVRSLILGRPIPLHFGVVLCVSISCTMMLSLLRARVRVDGEGITRRGLVGWRTYPWDEILSRPAQALCVGQHPWTGAPRRIRRLYAMLRWLEENKTQPVRLGDLRRSHEA